MAVTITLNVSYGQLAVYSSALQQPFNDWTDQHVDQGFAWRPGSVSFRTMAEAGPHSIEVTTVDHVYGIDADVVRAIEVPFVVPIDGAIEVASISDAVALSLTPGSFLLRCEFLRPAATAIERVRLIFAKEDVPRFAVVRADQSLSVSGELLTTARAAPA